MKKNLFLQNPLVGLKAARNPKNNQCGLTEIQRTLLVWSQAADEIPWNSSGSLQVPESLREDILSHQSEEQWSQEGKGNPTASLLFFPPASWPSIRADLWQ